MNRAGGYQYMDMGNVPRRRGDEPLLALIIPGLK